jgi:HAD superfamily hydrolase (TIGR01509 family)
MRVVGREAEPDLDAAARLARLADVAEGGARARPRDGGTGIGRQRPVKQLDGMVVVVEDGKPRFDGVRDFLKSRGIDLPEGTPHDPPHAETVGGLGNRKNRLVTKAIEEKGVEPYDGSLRFIRELRGHGCKVAVVSSSENCEAVLKAAKVDGLFEVRVDGAMVEAQHLAGKPAPDTFLIAARLLGVEPSRAVVVEDALSGIEAGLAGNFGLVIGVARRDNAEELRRHGAHLVVNDLGELVD